MTKLLLLDDRESHLFAELLIAHDIDAVGVSSAREALRWLEKNDVGIVITDLAMAEMDGLSFIEHLDSDKYRIAVLTGHSVDLIAAAILKDAGVEKIFVKSNNVLDLVKKIKDWL